MADEASLKQREEEQSYEHRVKMKKAILEGDWAEVSNLCTLQPFKHDRAFLYDVNKQAFLEVQK